MRSYCAKGLTALLLILFSSVPAYALEIRGSIAYDSFIWDPQNFAGFDYDIDSDLGSNTLTTNLLDDNRLYEDGGIIYETSNQNKALSNAKVGDTYGMLRVAEIDNVTGRILLTNEDNTITLRKNRSIEIMPGISIKTADADELRYYIYKEFTEPGTYEIRSSVADGSYPGSYTWTAENFAGFYYDINANLGTEALTIELNDGNGSIWEPRGVTYTTTAQPKEFEYYDWGIYSVIGFLGDEYFAGYHESADYDAWSSPILYDVSEDESSLADEQLEKILMDEDLNRIVKKGESIKLKEGYELVLKGISDEGRIYLNLLKDGELVEESFISPSVDGATIRDKTYYYRKDVGSQENVAIIAAHFRTTYKDEDYAMAVFDGIWQISETPLDVSEGTVYGKMTIQSVTSDSIVMDNEDNDITLERKSDIELMPGFHIRTADNETLRYYIYRMVTVGQDSS